MIRQWFLRYCTKSTVTFGVTLDITPGASLVAQTIKNLPAIWETWVRPLCWEDPLEKITATHSSILVWRIPMDRGAWWATVHGVAKSQTWRATKHTCYTPKAQVIKKKWTSPKFKTCVHENTINKVREPTEWEKIFVNHLSNKFSKFIKNYNSTHQNPTKPN